MSDLAAQGLPLVSYSDYWPGTFPNEGSDMFIQLFEKCFMDKYGHCLEKKKKCR